jgi:hypothetical protein
MHASKQQISVVEYPKTSFTIGAVASATGIALSAYLAVEALEEFAQTVWIVTAVGLGLLLTVFIVPCLLTSHAVGEKGLHLRMGLLINATVPYTAIREMALDSVKRGAFTVGIGVRHKAKSGTLFVTSSFRNLVAIKLNTELKLGGMLGPRVGQIVISVRDVNGFLDKVAAVSGAGEED